jgi:hypothetical protein
LLASAGAFANTVQVEVDGLNCALCSEKMKTTLMTVAHADTVVPRLDCGKIFFDVSRGSQFNEVGLRTTLLSEGFTMGAVREMSASAATLGAASC